ncbi:MAG: leucine-rich repeat domain-containing protein [Pirellulaceae bacterium]
MPPISMRAEQEAGVEPSGESIAVAEESQIESTVDSSAVNLKSSNVGTGGEVAVLPEVDVPVQFDFGDAESKQGKGGALVELHFRKSPVDDDLAASIGSCGELVKLTINTSKMTLEGWKQIGKLSKLQQLDLRGCNLGNRELAAAVEGLSKLRALRMNGKSGATLVDDVGLECLSGCKELKALALDHLWVSGDGLAVLSELPKLVELYLAGTLVDDDAMKRIVECEGMKKLRISQTSVGGPGILALAKLPLEDLDLSECSQLGDDALESLGELESLKKLNLFKTVISDTGIGYLSGLQSLEWFNVDQTPVSDAGLETIGKLSSLKFLHLGSTGVTDNGMPSLSELRSLENLIVTRTAVTETSVEELKSALPKLKVQLKYEGSN